ncbi:hypothetical protein OUZ56_007340 [Daphnia magna]|uniref:Uncharacterized protein n=1 Tax=Daphnia magna TaxID=35525 RepID=A0ABQ9YYB1_9CRUS|nr:hypothetical protein OUZ56_007340 [Daphnia magna]
MNIGLRMVSIVSYPVDFVNSTSVYVDRFETQPHQCNPIPIFKMRFYTYHGGTLQLFGFG